jgi:hypothetical protein
LFLCIILSSPQLTTTISNIIEQKISIDTIIHTRENKKKTNYFLLSLKYLSAFSLNLNPRSAAASSNPQIQTGRQDVNAIVGGAMSLPAPYHHARLVGISAFVFLFCMKAVRMMLWVLRSGFGSYILVCFWLSPSLPIVFALVLLPLGLSSSLFGGLILVGPDTLFHRVIVLPLW